MSISIKRMQDCNKNYLSISLSFILFGAIIAFLTSWINYQVQYTNIDSEIQTRFELEKNNRKSLLKMSTDKLEYIVSALVENPLTRAYIKENTPETSQNAHDLFFAFALANTEIMQLRFIDKNGYESIRIDRGKNSKYIHVIPNDLLQDKSQRYYFKETAMLPARQFWHSNIDLNIENGKLELPLRPTFRVASPVYGHNEFLGIVIVNVEASKMLTTLSASSDFDVILIDGDGEILQHPDSNMSWSRYLPNKAALKNLYPDSATQLLINPDSTINDIYSFSLDSIYRNNEKLQVIMIPRQEMLSSLIEGNLIAALFIAIIVIVISFPLSWLAAMFPARLQTKLCNTLSELKRLSHVLDRNVIVSTTDKDGYIINVSEAFTELTEFNLSEIQGETHRVVRSKDTSDKTYQTLWDKISTGQIWRGELKNKTKSGKDYWISTIITPKTDNQGNTIGYVQISQDITAKKIIEKLSAIDGMTQLFNRRKLDQILEAEMQRFKRYKQSFTVIILDLDRFKSINDTHGHQAGDDVLIKTAECLKLNLRIADYAGRWGGEEFLIICTGTDVEGGLRIAEKLRKSIELLQFPFKGQVTASFGVSQCTNNESLNQLILRADTALYRAKDEGRNRVCKAEESEEA